MHREKDKPEFKLSSDCSEVASGRQQVLRIVRDLHVVLHRSSIKLASGRGSASGCKGDRLSRWAVTSTGVRCSLRPADRAIPRSESKDYKKSFFFFPFQKKQKQARPEPSDTTSNPSGQVGPKNWEIVLCDASREQLLCVWSTAVL